jgi:hypothetical protein
VVDAAVELDFEAAQPSNTAGAQFGAVRGRVVVDDRVHQVQARGFANAGALRASGARVQTMLAAEFGAGGALLLRVTPGDDRSTAVHFADGVQYSFTGVRAAVSLDGDHYTPSRFEVHCDEQAPVRARLLSRMPILRPTGGGGYVRVTFGVARCEWGVLEGYGLYEYAQPVEQ